MTTYDKIAHIIGQLAVALLGAQAAGIVPTGYFPVWLIVVAWVLNGVVQGTTMPVANRPVAMSATTAANDRARATGSVSTLTPPTAVVLLLGLALGLTGCPPAGPGPTPATPGSTFGHCTTDALRTASEGILGEVTTALATGDYVGALAQLATTFGTAEVGCAVDLVIAEFSAKAMRSNDAQVAIVLTHAQAWRGSNP